MRIVQLSNEGWEAVGRPDSGATVEQMRAATVGILVALNTDVELCYLQSVVYDHKSDRYAATFSGSEKKAVLKIEDPKLIEFLARNLRVHGSWRGRLFAGVLVDANLVQP